MYIGDGSSDVCSSDVARDPAYRPRDVAVPEGEGATGDSDVTRAVGRIQRRPGGPGIEAGKARTRVAEGVQDEGEVLGVHVLVERGEGVEVRFLRARLAGGEPGHAPGQHGG